MSRFTMQDINFKKILLVTMIIYLVISALIGIIVFLFGEFWDTAIKLLLTTLIIGIYILTGLCSSSLYEKRKFFLLLYLENSDSVFYTCCEYVSYYFIDAYSF